MVVTGSLQASYRGALRIDGFEGEAGREGEGATPTNESSYRRPAPDARVPCRVRESEWAVAGLRTVGTYMLE